MGSRLELSVRIFGTPRVQTPRANPKNIEEQTKEENPYISKSIFTSAGLVQLSFSSPSGVEMVRTS